MTSVLKTVCSLLHNKLIFQKLPEIGDFFAVNRKKIITESWSCVWLFVFRRAVLYRRCSCRSVGKRAGVWGSVQEEPERAVLLVPGEKIKSGRFLVGGRHMCCPLL